MESQFLTRNVDANLAFLEERLKTAPGGGPFLCGKDLTAADILMSFPVIAASQRLLKSKKEQEKYPKFAAYSKQLENELGYKRAVAKVEEVDGKFSASM